MIASEVTDDRRIELTTAHLEVTAGDMLTDKVRVAERGRNRAGWVGWRGGRRDGAAVCRNPPASARGQPCRAAPPPLLHGTQLNPPAHVPAGQGVRRRSPAGSAGARPDGAGDGSGCHRRRPGERTAAATAAAGAAGAAPAATVAGPGRGERRLAAVGQPGACRMTGGPAGNPMLCKHARRPAALSLLHATDSGRRGQQLLQLRPSLVPVHYLMMSPVL